MNTYRVFYLNQYQRSFSTRDAALDYVLANGGPDDFEILDKSDYLN